MEVNLLKGTPHPVRPSRNALLKDDVKKFFMSQGPPATHSCSAQRLSCAFEGSVQFPMNQIPPELQAFVQQASRDNPGASSENQPQPAATLAYWALMMQQQQQQRSNPGDWAPLLAALAGADPQQIAPILAALLPKPNGGAASAGQDADNRAGVAGLRAAAQAQGGEGSGEGTPAFTELAGRVFSGKGEGDAAAGASAPKETMQLDTASLLPLLQLTSVPSSKTCCARWCFGLPRSHTRPCLSWDGCHH